jgi:hypothetical protein
MPLGHNRLLQWGAGTTTPFSGGSPPAAFVHLTGTAARTLTESGGVLTLAAGATHAHVSDVIAITGSNVANARLGVVFTAGATLTTTGQLPCVSASLSWNGTQGWGLFYLTANDQTQKERVTRRSAFTTSTSGTASGVLNAQPATAQPVVSGQDFCRILERVGSGGSRTYNHWIEQPLGTIVSGSSGTTGSQTDANTDQFDGLFGFSCAAQAMVVKTVILWDLTSPNILTFTQPGGTTVAAGGTVNLVCTAQAGDQAAGHSVNFQYQNSATQNGVYADVSGMNTGNSTTPALAYPADNGLWWRCKVTDTTNSKVSYTDPVQITVNATAGPALTALTTFNSTANGHNKIKATFDVALTLLSSSVAKWAAIRNGVALTITNVAVSGNDVELTVAERFLSVDTGITLALLTNDAIKGTVSNIVAEPFAASAVTNASPSNFTPALATHSDEITCFKGVGYDIGRLDVTRATFTGTLATALVNPISMPNLAMTAVTALGSGNLGTYKITAGNTAHEMSGTIFGAITVSDGFNTKSIIVPVYICDRSLAAYRNKSTFFVIGTSTAHFWVADGFVNNIASKMGPVADPTEWPHVTVVDDAGGFGQSGYVSADWIPYDSKGFLKQAHSWGVKNGAWYCFDANSYLNDNGNGFGWTGQVKSNTTLRYQFLADNYYSFSCEMSGRYDAGALGTANIVSVTGGTTIRVTGTGGTINGTSAGKVLTDTKADGSKQVRDILTSTANGGDWDFVIDSAFAETPAGAVTTTSGARRDLTVLCNAGRLELCQGGAEAIVGEVSPIIPVNTNILVLGRDNLNTDLLHIEHNANGVGMHIGLVRDVGFMPFVTKDATLALSSSGLSIAPSGTKAVSIVMGGYPSRADYFPADTVNDGVWAITADTSGGASFNSSTKTLTAGPTAGSITLRYTHNIVPLGGSPLVATRTFTVEAEEPEPEPEPTPPASSPYAIPVGVVSTIPIDYRRQSGSAGLPGVLIDRIDRNRRDN